MDEPLPLPIRPSRASGALHVYRFVLVLLVCAVALLGVALAAATDRLDTALLFVGVPCLLALLIGVAPAELGWPAVFQTLTVVLLLASALLHEGALCVLLASPLIYGAAGMAYAVAKLGRDRHRLMLGPVLAVVLLEGIAPGWRIAPDQDVAATSVTPAGCAAVVSALARPTPLDEDRPPLLHAAQYPTPVSFRSDHGLQTGSRWTLAMPAGAIETQVRSADLTERGQVSFDVVSDTARTTRWVSLHNGSVTWEPAAGGGCRVTVAIAFERRLDPAFWFGPITDTFMHAGADTLARMIARSAESGAPGSS